MMEKAAVTPSTSTTDRAAPGTSEGPSFTIVQTSIPFLWRQQLAVVRIITGGLGLILFVLYPNPGSLFVVPVLGIYTAWSAWLAAVGSSWSFDHPIAQLGIDLIAFGIFATHPAHAGMWLATFDFFYLILLTTLFYHFHVVLALTICCSAVLAALQTYEELRLWPVCLLAGSVAVLLAVQKGLLEERLSMALRRSILSRSEAEIAREKERQRIAADFHDGPLQSFISFQMRLEIIRKLMSRDSEAAMKELIQLQDLGRAQVTELRAFVRVMQPTEITSTNLAAAIRETVEHFERDSGVRTELICPDLSEVHESIALDVLQMVRETLNNVRKHSKASRVSLKIFLGPEGLAINVRDDGTGFPFSGTYTLDELEILRLGPRSIKRRVRTLGGEMQLESRPTEGTAISIRVPVRR